MCLFSVSSLLECEYLWGCWSTRRAGWQENGIQLLSGQGTLQSWPFFHAVQFEDHCGCILVMARNAESQTIKLFAMQLDAVSVFTHTHTHTHTHTCTHPHIVTSQVRWQLHIIILHLLVMLAEEKGVANGTKHKLYTEMFECESDHSRSMH